MPTFTCSSGNYMTHYTATYLALGDDQTIVVSIPFSFNYFGVGYTHRLPYAQTAG